MVVREHAVLVQGTGAGHIAAHCRTCGCRPSFSSVSILKRHRKAFAHEIIEALAIEQSADDCVSMPSITYDARFKRRAILLAEDIGNSAAARNLDRERLFICEPGRKGFRGPRHGRYLELKQRVADYVIEERNRLMAVSVELIQFKAMINEIGALLTSDPTEIGELEEKLDILLLKEASLKELDREIEPSVEDEALAEEVKKTYGVLLLTVLRKAIPADIGLEYSRKVNAQSVNRENELRGFLSFLKGEVECRERMQPVTEGTVRRRSDSAEGPRVPSAAALTTTTEADNRCVFCRTDDHGPDSCVSGLSLEDRKAVLQRENRCFRCTKRGHLSRVCRGARWLRCARCGGRHVTAMCNPNVTRRGTQAERDAAITAVKEVAGGEVLQSSLEIQDKTTGRSKNQVLLQTARVWAEGLQGRTLLRLLLDGGSQRTFVRRDISERLHLRMLGEEDVRIFTFGGNATTNPTKCRRVELWLRSRFDRKEVRVEALEVPCICADLVMAPSEVVVTQMKMEGMNIADVTPDNAVEDGIGLLIGADHYWDVVTGSVRRLRPKLMAVDTVFGWTLQGPFGTTKSKAICSTATNVMRATSDGGGADEGPADGPVKGSYPPYLPELPELRVIIEETSGVEEPAEGVDGEDSAQCQVGKLSERFDCYPEPGSNEAGCLSRGCCWGRIDEIPGEKKLDIPYCYFPINYVGYYVENVEISDDRINVMLVRRTPSGIDVDVPFVHVLDHSHRRFVPPVPKIPFRTFSGDRQYVVGLDKSSGKLVVQRRGDSQTVM
ncbi:hypothetical protein HPB47_002172 [Ixodes persulcatus]|uniref:Uncharacterized protein n=1 Tax=Ixodes persulcatus TaxID=34615 RepID=A0AC60PLZ3_IXOPE|nr:hypothetical protein HPB47_002172 [Ixodes persulcatus]